MSDALVFPTNDGQEIQQGDVQNLGAVSGLADDRVIAEFLRLPVFGSSPVKAILPYEIPYPGFNFTGLASTNSTVQPSGSANGSVTINPFRAIVGSRNTAAGAPPSPNPAANFQSNALANWRDIRGGVFIGSSSSLTLTQAFASNSSGNPRWDVVYAVITPDGNGPSVTRRVKNPSTGVVAATSVAQYLNSPVAIGVAAGTPGVTPTVPTIPADSGGNYYFQLAAVRIPNGFTSGSTISSRDIRSLSGTIGGGSLQQWRSLRGQFDPATGNNDGPSPGAYATNFPWVASSAGVRPGPFLPPDWVGGIINKFVAVDVSTGSGSHANASIVDNSVDWRNRMVQVFAYVAGTASALKFPFDSGATGAPGIFPSANGTGSVPTIQGGQTLYADGALVTNQATVLNLVNAVNGQVAAGAQIGFYCDLTGAVQKGALLFFLSGTAPTCRMLAWIQASPQFPNY